MYILTCNGLNSCCWSTGGFQGMPAHFDSGRVIDNADSQQNQPEPVLRAAGKKFNLV